MGQHETFSYLTERRLLQSMAPTKVEVMVSVIEEPATGLYYLEKWGITFDPTLVVLGITLGNDIAQTHVRLATEYTLSRSSSSPILSNSKTDDAAAYKRGLRELAIPSRCLSATTGGDAALVQSDVENQLLGRPNDHSLRLLQALQPLFIQRTSSDVPQTVLSTWGAYRRPRLFDNNGLGVFLVEQPAEMAAALGDLLSLLLAYDHFCERHGVDFLVVLFPQRYQVQPRDWEKTVEVYGLNKNCFDLDAPNKLILSFCERQNIRCVDSAPALRASHLNTGMSNYLPNNDMHWNPSGHRVVAEMLAPVVERILGEVKDN